MTEVAAGIGGAPSPRDPVVALLASRDREVHLANLRRALADFDAATIATTHAFCQEMLSGLGIAGDHEPEAQLVEDVRDLQAEVVDDLYVWRLAGGNPNDRPSYAEAQRIAAAATEQPIVLAPAERGMALKRRKTADWTRRVLTERKRRMAVVTYDDLVLRLGQALHAGPEAVERLRDRYDVVLVDEFQDTDPDQWEILRTAFGDRALVLIGDPKQAIYAFRGGDVYAYLDAAGTVERQELNRNHRSDGPLIRALDVLFDGAQLGHEEITYRPVEAEHVEPRLTGAPDGALRMRFALAQDLPERTAKGWATTGPTRDYVASDTAADIAELLSSDARIEGRAIAPSDIAVLVRNRWQARDVSAALSALDVPAVIAGAGSVFDTDAAHEWLRLLEALERPGATRRAHAVALTCFFGWSAERCALAADGDWEGLHDTLHDWAQVLRNRGVASLTETVTREQDLSARVLGELGGERALTDVRHIAQLLHGAALADGLGPTALAQWLRRRIAEAERDSADEDRSRRLESDAQRRAGPDRAPRQGPRVRHRLPARISGTSRRGRPATRPGGLPRRRQPAHPRRLAGGSGVPGSPGPAAAGAARRGPAAALRRADPRQAPGRRCGGRRRFRPRDSPLGRLMFARDGASVPDQMDAPPRRRDRDDGLPGAGRALRRRRSCSSAPCADAARGVGRASRRRRTGLAAARFDRDIDTTLAADVLQRV